MGVLDVRLPGRGNSNSHAARPVHLIITMIRWKTIRLSIKNSLIERAALLPPCPAAPPLGTSVTSGKVTQLWRSPLPRVVYHQVYNVHELIR